MHNSSKPTVTALLLLLTAPAAWSQQVTLDVPAEVSVGQAFSVTYSTDGDLSDYIAFTYEGAEPNRYNYGWHRASAGSPAKFSAPTNPGTYVVRFIVAESTTIILEKQIIVSDSPATVSVPDTVSAGDELVVTFSGPMNDRDYISMTDPDAPNANYKHGY